MLNIFKGFKPYDHDNQHLHNGVLYDDPIIIKDDQKIEKKTEEKIEEQNMEFLLESMLFFPWSLITCIIKAQNKKMNDTNKQNNCTSSHIHVIQDNYIDSNLIYLPRR
jgi:hypothetical protein